MRLAVLGSSDSWYANDLQRAAEGRHTIERLTFRQIQGSISGTDSQVSARQLDLRNFDCILVRSMPPGSLEQVVFRMDLLGQLEASGVRVINPPRSLEVAVDKYLATARLQAAGLDVPRTCVCQTADDAMAAFDSLGRDVVVKPLFGSEGRGITRITDPDLAHRAFRLLEQLGSVAYLQEFVPHHGFDLRVLLIGPRALVIRRRNPKDWRTNVSRGAVAEAVEARDEWIIAARRAAAAVGAPLAGVDLLPAQGGQLYVLEVNAVPGWKGLAAALQIDVAAQILEWIGSEEQKPRFAP